MTTPSRHPDKTRGFSLVELMVALTIGLIILGAVSTLFVSSRQTYTTQDQLARLQENARFAMQFIIKDLRLAGYYGCVSEIGPDTVNSTLKDSSDFPYNAQLPLEGLNDSGSWYPSGSSAPSGIHAGTDAVAIRRGGSGNIYLDKEMPNESAVLKVNSISGLTVGDIIMISDCASVDIMQITHLNSADPHIVHNSGSSGPPPGNSTQKLSKAYSPSTAPDGTKVMKFETRVYYIATGASGNPALFRQINGKTPVELVEGIENLQILYGKDTDGNGLPNVYLQPGAAGLQTEADWSSVKSARIGILARTLNDKGTEIDTGAYDIDGDCVPGAPVTDSCYDFTLDPNDRDRYKRRVFQAVVQLRNLQ